MATKNQNPVEAAKKRWKKRALGEAQAFARIAEPKRPRGRPRSANPQLGRTALRLPEELLEACTRAAARNGVSLSEWMRVAAEMRLESSREG